MSLIKSGYPKPFPYNKNLIFGKRNIVGGVFIMQKNNYYVYEWIRLDTNEPFYVGKGKGNRWRHLVRERNLHFNRIVDSRPVAVCILENNLDEKTAFEYEVFYINEYKNLGLPLTNILDGGEQPPIVHLNGSKNGMYGRKGELASFYGKKHSDETRKLMSELRQGCIPWNKDKHTGNNKEKQVICLTTGEIFNSAKSAEKKYKIARGSVPNCCLGRSFGGRKGNLPLIWLWYNEYLKMTKEEIQNKIIKGFEKVAYCITTREIFFNVSEASIKYSLDNSAISNCIRGKSQTSGQLKDGTRLKWCRYSDYIMENNDFNYQQLVLNL